MLRTSLVILALAVAWLPAVAQPPCPPTPPPMPTPVNPPPCPAVADDGFAVTPSCTPVTPSLPLPPAFTSPGLATVWADCAPTDDGVNVCIGQLAALDCDHFVLPITITFTNVLTSTGANLTYTGSMGGLIAKYARTWKLQEPNRPEGQVWRYVLNGDLIPNEVVFPQIPITANAFNNLVHFAGSIDFYCRPLSDEDPEDPYQPWEPEEGTGVGPGGGPKIGPQTPGFWSFRLDCTHFSDVLHHHPMTPRSAQCTDQGATFTIVAPPLNTGLAPVAPPQSANMTLESMRDSQLPPGGPDTCFSECGVGNVALQTTNQHCLGSITCMVPAVNPGRYFDRTIFTSLNCGGTSTGIVNVGADPEFPTGFVEFDLGTYQPIPTVPRWLHNLEVWSVFCAYGYLPMCTAAHWGQPLFFTHPTLGFLDVWAAIGTDTAYSAGATTPTATLFTNNAVVFQHFDMANQVIPVPQTVVPGGWLSTFGVPAGAIHVVNLSQ